MFLIAGYSRYNRPYVWVRNSLRYFVYLESIVAPTFAHHAFCVDISVKIFFVVVAGSDQPREAGETGQ